MKKTFLAELLEGVTDRSQAEIARRLGWSPQRLSYVVRSDSLPLREVYRLLKASGVGWRRCKHLLDKHYKTEKRR